MSSTTTGMVYLVVLVASNVQISTAQMQTSIAQTRQIVKNAPGNHVRSVHKLVVRKAQVRYAQLPRWGAAIHTLPPPAIVIN